MFLWRSNLEEENKHFGLRLRFYDFEFRPEGSGLIIENLKNYHISNGLCEC